MLMRGTSGPQKNKPRNFMVPQLVSSEGALKSWGATRTVECVSSILGEPPHGRCRIHYVLVPMSENRSSKSDLCTGINQQQGLHFLRPTFLAEG